jgi:putative membrane-bound dehydrogenase-like protein
MTTPLLLTLLAPFHALPQDTPAFVPPAAPVFATTRLTEEFLAEGATFGDLDRDGHRDVIAGPYWWAGPGFSERRELYTPKVFDPKGYSENFFAWTEDFDGDGALDVLFVGFPGKEAWWLENPGLVAAARDGAWTKHHVHPNVDNESPAYTDLDGDGKRELVFHSAGVIGYAKPAADPRAPWVFHGVSEKTDLPAFTHGLGVGDLDGDGRKDILLNHAWWRQPEASTEGALWQVRPLRFSAGYGGAQMLVHDVDGDGDQDVVSSLMAHRYGLSWFENTGQDGPQRFKEHTIMATPDSRLLDGFAVSELHALDLADFDGDGVMDFVTGKRFMSHSYNEAGSRDPAWLLWFRCVRSETGVSFEPRAVHADSGVGTQVTAGDIDGDGHTDVVVANKQGVFVHLQRPLEEPEPATGTPRAKDAPRLKDERFPPGAIAPRGEDGRVLNLDFETGDLTDWTAEGKAFAGQPIAGDTVHARRGDMTSDHEGRYWIGGYELHEDKPTGKLTSAPFELVAPFAAFLIAGGPHHGTRLDVVRERDGRVLAEATGYENEALRPAVLDLTRHVGEVVRLCLSDEHTGHWGHINFDHFRLYAERPRLEGEIKAQRDVVAHAGLSPTDAAAAMDVPPGFRVDVIAAEPDLHQPIALDIDARGRLWVAEAYSYPKKRGAGKGRDKLVVFSDGDADGTFESRTEFIGGLDLVSGFAVGHGGVWIGAAPELLFVPDADGDLVPDGAAEVVLDGWGYEDTHETLNAFTWGPDGWLYGCHGVFTHSRVGKPGTPKAEREPLNAGVWRLHPRTREFEVFAWGTSNPWGVDFDEHGQAFVTACVIPHLWHLAQGGRYMRQADEHFGAHVYADIGTIADHLHYLGDTPHDGNYRSDALGGGHAHCGLLLYQGNSFPAEYRGALLFGNVHGNRINSDVLERKGSGFVGKHGPDFLLANDQWFRAVNLRQGPAGEVYLIDWYDPQACHRNETEIWDRTNGRLYRIAHGERTHTAVDLGAASEAQLIALQRSDDEWHVRTARRLLAERGLGTSGAALLVEMLTSDPDPTVRLRALWTLHGAGALDELLLMAALDSRYEYVRAWAVQLLFERGAPSGSALARCADLARSDESPVVRLYLASALQRITPALRWDIADALVARSEDALDQNLPLMVWWAIEPLVPADPARAMALAERAALPRLREFIYRRAAAEPLAHEALFGRLAALDDDGERRTLLEGAWTTLKDRRNVVLPPSWPAAFARCAASSDATVRERALAVAAALDDPAALPALRAVLADRRVPRERRALALDALVRGRDRAALSTLESMLDEPAWRGDALRALAAFPGGEVAPAILARWGVMDGPTQADALATLCGRADSALVLLAAVRAGDVPPDKLSATHLRSLRALDDTRVAEALAVTWGRTRDVPEDRVAAVAAWKQRLTDERLAEADLAHGRAVFAKTCQRCHVLFGAGASLGPDITGSNRKDLDYLLTNMVDPSADVPLAYQMTIAKTDDERLVAGLLVREDDEVLVLRTESEEVTLFKDEVTARRPDASSMMPEGQLDALTEAEVVDLVAYLRNDAQVPERMGAENVARFFDGTTLTGWKGDPALWSVEDGVIVGRSKGLARNEFLVSEFELGDFRLVLDVQLDPDAGNSGVQVRSRSVGDADVAGYQADIGAGYWGTLYDEHGRGTLVGGDHAALVKPGAWNRYEIVVSGETVQLALNGVQTARFVDPKPTLRGVTALQLHSGGAFTLRVRIVSLELDPVVEAGAR